MSAVELTVLVGTNLNLTQARGFAGLDVLSAISEADEFDQMLNPQGTQRDLNLAHARKIASYARAVQADSGKPGAFPEVILNVRKPDAIVSVVRAGEKISWEQLVPGDLAKVSIDSKFVNERRGTFDPVISRVDGNHRLAAAEINPDDLANWPTVPFAIFVGLTRKEERSLFAAINGNQRKMDTSHLSNIAAALGGDALLLDPATTPLWFANHLTESGRVFHDRVYKGGSKDGVKKEFGFIPPMKLKGLETSIKQTLAEIGVSLPDLLTSLSDARGGSEEAAETLTVEAALLATLIERFWTAVGKAYPAAWAENSGRKRFILFQATGISAFSKLCGSLILEMGNSGTPLSQDNFDNELGMLSQNFSLDADDYVGYAGAAGASQVTERLVAARNSPHSKIRWALSSS